MKIRQFVSSVRTVERDLDANRVSTDISAIPWGRSDPFDLAQNAIVIITSIRTPSGIAIEPLENVYDVSTIPTDLIAKDAKPDFTATLSLYGNPAILPNCKHCQCYPVGTYIKNGTFLPICNGFTGDCDCKPNVVGKNCEKCADGYFNIDSGNGCDPCNCDAIGSRNQTCHEETGQCNCNPGVTGQRCDQCMPQHWGFSQDGCQPCDCDPTGSLDLQCDRFTGQCQCRDKVEGRKCDRCMENTKTTDRGRFGEKNCEPCDDCYNLVKQSTDEHRKNLDDLDKLLQQIAENPEPVGDDFEYQLKELVVRVRQTLADARISSQNEEGGTLRDRLEGLRVKLGDVIQSVMTANSQIGIAQNHGVEANEKVQRAKEVIDRAKESLKVAQRQLETQGREALRKAEERSKKFGRESEKMSNIAREAGALAEK